MELAPAARPMEKWNKRRNGMNDRKDTRFAAPRLAALTVTLVASDTSFGNGEASLLILIKTYLDHFYTNLSKNQLIINSFY